MRAERGEAGEIPPARRRVACAALAAVVAGLLAAPDAGAQSLPSAPPLPPPRPAMPDDPPKTPAAQPEDRTGATERTREAPLQAPVEAPPDDAHIAPGVDRGVLRACAVEWHRMKASGAAAGKIWREFASECVTRHQQGK